MFSLKELIFTPEVASQSLNLFQNPAESEKDASERPKRRTKSTVKRRDKGLELETSFYQPRRLELGDFFESENEEGDDQESVEKPPRVRKNRKARKTDKSIPRFVRQKHFFPFVHDAYLTVPKMQSNYEYSSINSGKSSSTISQRTSSQRTTLFQWQIGSLCSQPQRLFEVSSRQQFSYEPTTPYP